MVSNGRCLSSASRRQVVRTADSSPSTALRSDELPRAVVSSVSSSWRALFSTGLAAELARTAQRGVVVLVQSIPSRRSQRQPHSKAPASRRPIVGRDRVEVGWAYSRVGVRPEPGGTPMLRQGEPAARR